MGRYSGLLTVFFLLLTGCGSTQYPDEIWAPKSAPYKYGGSPEMEDIAKRCNNGYYSGFSPENLFPIMSQRCEKIENGNSICAAELIDSETHKYLGQEFDSKTNSWHSVTKEDTNYYHYMINLYINTKGLVYDCKASYGHHVQVSKKPKEGTLAAKMPKE